MNSQCPECGKSVELVDGDTFARHRSKPGTFCPRGQTKEQAAANHQAAIAAKKKRKRKGKRAPMVCPVHSHKLVGAKTQYGRRYACPEKGCTVVQWAGSTSTPADAATRAARIKAHDAFDALWMRGPNGSRSKAYAAMAKALNIPPSQCHIGMFSVEQCEQVIEFASEAVS